MICWNLCFYGTCLFKFWAMLDKYQSIDCTSKLWGNVKKFNKPLAFMIALGIETMCIISAIKVFGG